MTPEGWIGLAGLAVGLGVGIPTLIVAVRTLRATRVGVAHARVAAEASQAALDAQRAREAIE